MYKYNKKKLYNSKGVETGEIYTMEPGQSDNYDDKEMVEEWLRKEAFALYKKPITVYRHFDQGLPSIVIINDINEL